MSTDDPANRHFEALCEALEGAVKRADEAGLAARVAQQHADSLRIALMALSSANQAQTPPPVRHGHELSDQGIKFLMALEGVELEPYRDVAGIWTIGVGHVIRDGEDHLRSGITRSEAMDLLESDVEWAEDAVNGLRLPKVLSQHQFDALCCFCFNVGARAFNGSTMVRKLKAGDYDCVPAELARWRYVTDPATGRKVVSAGLVNRRRQTGELWSRGDYTVTW